MLYKIENKFVKFVSSQINNILVAYILVLGMYFCAYDEGPEHAALLIPAIRSCVRR
jgi:hypothetical protein